MSISGPCWVSPFSPSPDLQLRHGSGQFFGKGVVDAFLDQEPVGADAGLAGVAVLGGDGPLHRGIQVGIVEDDERGVAAQFQGHLLDRCRRTAP